LPETVCWPGFVRTRRELTGLSEIWIAENPRTGKADNGKEWRKGQRIRREKEKGKRGERGMERDKVPYRDFFSISSPADNMPGISPNAFFLTGHERKTW